MQSKGTDNQPDAPKGSAEGRLLFPVPKRLPMQDLRPKPQPIKPVIITVEEDLAKPEPVVVIPEAQPTLSEPELFNVHIAELPPKKPSPSLSQGFIAAFRNPKVRNHIVVYAGVLVIAAGLLHLGAIGARAYKIRSAVLGATSAGLAALGQGQSLVVDQQFADSAHAFDLAQDYFLQGKLDLQSEGQLTAALISATPQGQDANRILDAGKNISQAGISLTRISTSSKTIAVSASGFSTPSGLHQTLSAIDADAATAQQDLQAADSDLNAVNPVSVPAADRMQLTDATQKIQTYVQTIVEMRSLLSLANSFFTQGPQTILVLFENNNELRPGGGFIGTYGIYHVTNGVVTSQKISSIYDLDGQLVGKKKIAPPGQFAALTDSWALRDSNWFPDFRTDAQKASGFYELEGGETPDAVIAITPDVFEDLLRITGPIPFPKYNVTLTADNFRDTVQLDTSDKTSAIPKQMLADFAPLLLQKISALPHGGNTAIVNAVLDNLKRKNILAYDRSADVETQLVNANWAGSLATTDKDFLAVSSANLGGQKTDLSIKQSMRLQSLVQADSSIINTITYTRSHDDVANDPNNIAYVRFVVPKGSVLLTANGFTREPYYKADGSAYTSFESMQSFSIDPDLAKIDATAVVDAASGTVSDVEGNYTTFGNWMVVGPGQSQTVTLTYALPFKYDAKSQSLIAQKQPGATDIAFTYAFGAASGTPQLADALWYTPDAASVKNGIYAAQATINADQVFGAVFKSK
jgi:hypothetical protein